MKSSEIRQMSDDEIQKAIVEGKRKLLTYRIQRVNGRLEHGHLVNNSAGFNNGNPEFWIPFTRTHTSFCWFSRNRLIRKNSYPNFSATFHKPGNRDSPGFNLTGSKPVWFSRLKSVITECQFRSAISLTFKIPFHHLSMFNFFRA